MPVYCNVSIQLLKQDNREELILSVGRLCRDCLQEFICCREHGQGLDSAMKDRWNRKRVELFTLLKVMFVGSVVCAFPQ